MGAGVNWLLETHRVFDSQEGESDPHAELPAGSWSGAPNNVDVDVVLLPMRSSLRAKNRSETEIFLRVNCDIRFFSVMSVVCLL